jgi:hypothetical protein
MKFHISLLAMLLCFSLGPTRTRGQADAKTAGISSKAKTARKVGTVSEGEKRFSTNCGRCHHPPEDIPPSAARAVIRHMRVRAMLSADDEKLILEFLAP